MLYHAFQNLSANSWMTIAGLIIGMNFGHAACLPAAEWGNLKGRFVYDGPSPERAVLTINKDPEFCGKHSPKSERLIVHPKDRGLANVVIWLDLKASEKVAIHQSYSESASAPVRLSNRGCRFDPHVCVLRPGQTLLIENPDQVDHNTAAGLDRNSPFNHVTAAGQSVKHNKFERSEKLPAQIQCSIHPWMTGWLVVKDHPYVAVTDEHGRFEIKNLPVGEHTFVSWHEQPNYLQEVSRGGEKQSWKNGKVTLKISPQPLDLGEVKIAPSMFAEIQ